MIRERMYVCTCLHTGLGLRPEQDSALSPDGNTSMANKYHFNTCVRTIKLHIEIRAASNELRRPAMVCNYPKTSTACYFYTEIENQLMDLMAYAQAVVIEAFLGCNAVAAVRRGRS